MCVAQHLRGLRTYLHNVGRWWGIACFADNDDGQCHSSARFLSRCRARGGLALRFLCKAGERLYPLVYDAT